MARAFTLACHLGGVLRLLPTRRWFLGFVDFTLSLKSDILFFTMETTVLNYRIIIEPDEQTGTKKPGFTAFCPTLGVADDGDTIEKAIKNIKGEIKAYVESLIKDKLPVPIDQPEKDLVTTTQINVIGRFQVAI